MLAKIPYPIKLLYPNRIWKLPSSEKVLYLTFDDGPIPELTPWVLEQLKLFGAKATFFCIGDNIQKHPEVFQEVLADGHSIGNHTNNHLNGWKTTSKKYFENVLQAEAQITSWLGPENRKSKLFRPPYGRLTWQQGKLLRREQYKIIMWEVISKDYDKRLSPEKVYSNVVRNASPGGIVIFHDSLKAESNLRQVLPKVLEYYSEQGYRFERIE